jgi:hypothetical protein
LVHLSKKKTKKAQKVEDYLQSTSTATLTGVWGKAKWTAIHGEGRVPTSGEYHICIMISSGEVSEAKIVKGLNSLTLLNIASSFKPPNNIFKARLCGAKLLYFGL